MQFLGRLHILILHLPIGILLLAVLLEWIHHLKIVIIPKNVRTLIYGLGALSAIMASASGYMLSVNGDYAIGITDNHMWAGLLTTLIALLLFWFSHKNVFEGIRWMGILMIISIIVTGHLGGTLTHGEGYLFGSSNSNANQSFPVFKISNIEEAKLYPDLIQPVLDAKCVNCHGLNKRKGKLRLDKESFLKKGGKSGKMLVGVEPNESELLRRIQLPLQHDDHMPPKKKPQLTEDEIKLIHWWIGKGSNFSSTLKELEAVDSIKQLVSRIVNANKQLNNADHDEVLPAVLPVVEVNMPTQKTLSELAALNIVALKAGKDSPFLELNFVNVEKIEPLHWKLMNEVQSNIIRLKMTGLNIKDEDLKHISKMNNLMRLYLDQTEITDVGLHQISSLAELRYLNINNTEISNAGIESLNRLKNLKTIYTYQTNVNLDSLTSGCQIIRGGFSLPFYETDTLRIPEN